MKRRKNQNKSFNRKLSRWTGFFLIVLTFILLGVFYRMTIGGEKYRAEGNLQNTKSAKIPAKRGTIYDRNGKNLTDTVTIKDLYYNGRSIKEEDFNSMNQELSSILSMNNILSNIEIGESSLLKKELSAEEIEQIESIEYPQLYLSASTRRHYPHGSLASSLIGFVDENYNPQSGIELSMNNILSGEPGKSIYHQNMKGEIIPFEEKIDYLPKDGEDIILTIDEKIQLVVETIGHEAMERLEADGLSIIVSNPKTGEILAMQDFPEYDLNTPKRTPEYNHLFLEEKDEEEGLDEFEESSEEFEETEEMDEKSSLKNRKKSLTTEELYGLWKNKSSSFIYEPGSVFKMITTAAALEEHTATKQSEYFCNGFVRDIPGFTIRCYSWMDPHGEESLEEALVNSCNPAYVQIARDLGKETFYQYIKNFGFGEPTNIDLIGEERGSFLDSSEDMGDANLATLSYGYGVSATPLQMLMASNACINGGFLLEPQLLLDEFQEDSNVNLILKRQVISKETSKELAKMLETVIKDGARNVKIPGYRIGGKSGTAMKFMNEEYNSKNVVSSCYGFFPVNDPEYSVLVMVNRPLDGLNGTTAAGPIVRDIFHQIIRYHSIEQDEQYIDHEEKRTIIVPDLIGMNLKDGTNIIRNLNLKVNVHTATTDDSLIITNQFPEAGESVEKNSIVFLEASESSSARVRVPDLKNLTITQLEKELEKVRLTYQTKDYGDGRALRTIPESGALVSPDTIIQVIFDKKELDDLEEKENEGMDDENNDREEDTVNSTD